VQGAQHPRSGLTHTHSRAGRHTDFVTALDFHPVDDKFFVSGSIDGKVMVATVLCASSCCLLLLQCQIPTLLL